MRVYTGYVNQYNALTATLSEMKRTEPKFNIFLESVRWQVRFSVHLLFICNNTH